MQEKGIEGNKSTSRNPSVYLVNKEAVVLLRITTRTGRNRRWHGIWVRFERLVRRCVKYRHQEIDSFITDEIGR